MLDFNADGGVPNRYRFLISFTVIVAGQLHSGALPAAAQPKSLAKTLQQIDATVLTLEESRTAASMLRSQIRRRLQAANDKSSQTYRSIETWEQWRAFRDRKREALRRSLGGLFSVEAPAVETRVANTQQFDDFTIENLLIHSRGGIWITANLYRPKPVRESMPGIVICHSHHTPKTHGELQDMGMTWARLGCLVLVMDQVGHGERRIHPFKTGKDYPQAFRVSRQDYYFRYDSGIQLHLAGSSLVGQIAWDLRRGVDYLLEQGGADPERIILLGCVAGGGDPAAVAAMIDERIQVAAPFNFGGPQPETRFPLPEDAEESFNYAGSGSWESTRNLRLSARDGFLPWVIVAGLAPRKLIFAHEFNWDRPRDPVWKRLQHIFGLARRAGNLAFTHGRGELRGRPPEATHCTHIGKFHRKLIHHAFSGWFEMADGSQAEYSSRVESKSLLCWTPELIESIRPSALHDGLRRALAEKADVSGRLMSEASVLGDYGEPRFRLRRAEESGLPDAKAVLDRVLLETDDEIVVPLLLIRPAGKKAAPVVVAVAQSGKQAFLSARADEIANLLRRGFAVCLPDLRGTGETRPGQSRGRRSSATSLSSSELMLGGTMVGARLHDLLGVIAYLRARGDVNGKRLAVWGDSFRAPNPAGGKFLVPRGISGRPVPSEPLGGLVALLAAAKLKDLAAVYVRGGLVSFASVLENPMTCVPHDLVIPGSIPAGDVGGLVAQLSETPVRFHRIVDGWNRLLDPATVRSTYAATGSAKGERSFANGDDSAADWIVDQLNPPSN